ncbi:putative methanol oxidation protein [Bradyrhizobium sp. STM 3843]|uniref:substrate-binding domain-containing protein n=1 Tax=Bradyrhizobium sp. STM 3843 TaxID=551947 RepID=UPI00024049CF|nr:substrate-binding domain-containing protein [Bradyrhizobium sp. STM 3843]CCE10492.1 putative methanol oxidation protein [Bradyrhizobium sp. STM 3843]
MRRRTESWAFLFAFAPALAIGVPGAVRAQTTSHELRVCADPNNLPFSNRAQQGFENRLAEMIAQRIGKTVSYTWFAQRRGFIRHTLKAGLCDVVIGVPAHYDLVETTTPYYRSTYVLVSRADRHLDLIGLDDPRLRSLTIGVHLIGDDGNNPPPAHALGQEGIIDNVRGFPIYGDYREPNPPARLIEAVANGDIDVAAAWGPLAGYFAKRSAVPLTITPIEDAGHFAPQRFQFAIAMGVRKGDDALRDQLQAFIDGNRNAIAALLREFGVPLVDEAQAASGGH